MGIPHHFHPINATMSAVLGLSGSTLVGQRVGVQQRAKASNLKVVTSANVKKGINRAKKGGAPNAGVSEEMNKKTFVDASGRKGKGYGVFRFDSKYGANVDGYSPIWSPNEWSETGDEYSGGTLGLVVWFALLSAGLGLAGYLIFSTSALA